MLDLAGHDFLATAAVSGTRDPNYSNQTQLGEFTLFDLTSQHLSRNTTIHLQETSLPFLHIELSVSPAAGAPMIRPTPDMVRGVSVPPSREAQSALYDSGYNKCDRATRTAKCRQVFVTGTHSCGTSLLRYRSCFQRKLQPRFRITDRPAGSPGRGKREPAGTILRVHLTQGWPGNSSGAVERARDSRLEYAGRCDR